MKNLVAGLLVLAFIFIAVFCGVVTAGSDSSPQKEGVYPRAVQPMTRAEIQEEYNYWFAHIHDRIGNGWKDRYRRDRAAEIAAEITAAQIRARGK